MKLSVKILEKYCRFLACNSTKTELPHNYLPRIFTANFDCTWRHFSFKPLDFECATLSTQPQFLGWKFGGFAIVAYSISCRCNLFIWFFWGGCHRSTMVMSYFPLSIVHKITAPLIYGLYFFKNISKRQFNSTQYICSL